jgi:hypothetical protein
VAENEEVQGSATAGGVPPSETVPLVEGGGTPTKPRSGFQRQKLRIARLTELYENLQNDYDQLLADHDKLGRDYVQLESAFAEVTSLNAELAAELRQTKQQRPAPVRYGSNLMGM